MTPCLCKTACKPLVLPVVVMVMMSVWLPQLCRAAPANLSVPPQLAPWVDWVLHGKEKELSCIPRYNDPDRLQCRWPGILVVNLTPGGGRFSQSWQIDHDAWVPVPGGAGQWPAGVRLNGDAAPLIMKDQRPMIRLSPGAHRIDGRFQWASPPEFIQIPVETARVSLTVDGQPILFPDRDSSGRLWLKQVRTETQAADRIKVETARLIEDAIPAEMTLQTALDVSGKAREITMGPLYDPAHFIPLSFKSDLPARLGQDGTLRLQVRPGTYSFSLALRHAGPLERLTFTAPETPAWPDHEIWSIVRRPELRIVEISGVPPVDPRQMSLPGEWKSYPAYRMGPDATMVFKETKRGDPDPAADQLTLDRTLWLQFDGSGYTIRDQIQGLKNSDWRLEMNGAITPGKVSVDGREQLITRRVSTDTPGVELRKGRVNLIAESRFESGGVRMPATGWNTDFQTVTGRLLLPPGWRLIHGGGMDSISGTWLKKWTLLDFFMVLLFTLATAKIFSIPFAAAGFMTLVLTFHEPGAPRFIWPALLLGVALLAYLPRGRLRTGVKGVHGIMVLLLLATAIPYAVQALRVGLYPQLEKPWISMNTEVPETGATPLPRGGSVSMSTRQLSEMKVEDVGRQEALDTARKMALPSSSPPPALFDAPPDSLNISEDPRAMTQTGPGLPRWKPFTTAPFSWTGPVAPVEEITFLLMGPGVNRILAFIRVGLVALLAAGLIMAGWKPGRGKGWMAVKAIAVGAGVLMIWVSPCPAGEIPSPRLLEELQQRLLARDTCYPRCADVTAAAIDIGPDQLGLRLAVTAHLDTLIPLPGHARHWLPADVGMDGHGTPAMIRENETLWMQVPAGVHQIDLKGPVPGRNTFQLPFPLKPQAATVTTRGWSVQGYHENGTLDDPLHFTRISPRSSSAEKGLETGTLPPFARVERRLLLGLDWTVTTTVHRMSPLDTAMTLSLPLLPGESTISEQVKVLDGRVEVNMGAGQRIFKWHSFLDKVETLVLTHEKTRDWTEVWILDVGTMFHVEPRGIPVILHTIANQWMPTWHPWPGEEVTLEITRPEAVDGQVLTLEKSQLVLRPGHRSTHARLLLVMNSSQGGQHRIHLPEAAQLEEMRVDGKLRLIRQDGDAVVLPLSPGSRRVEMTWRESRGMSRFFSSSAIDLSSPSVNAGVDIHLPAGRWPLFVGGEPLMGPAVLFWSVLITVLLVSRVVASARLTPLSFFNLCLLGIGMSMASLWACAVVGLWLVVMNQRHRWGHLTRGAFNLAQVALAGLTIAAAGALLSAVSQGLLGHPDMNIIGNGSTAGTLRWFQDVSDPTLPVAWVISIPMVWYRVLMLAWALWIAFGVIRMAGWGWQQYTRPVIWYPLPQNMFRSAFKKPPKGDEKKGDVSGKGPAEKDSGGPGDPI